MRTPGIRDSFVVTSGSKPKIMRFGELQKQLACAVAGAVVDNDDVLWLVRTGGDAIEQKPDRRALVEAGNNDRQAHIIFK